MPTRGEDGAARGRPVDVPRAQVGLSTASVYPEGVAAAFGLAARLGYDGVEVMVWTDPLTREAGALRTLSELHGIPVLSVHAPTLLVSQRGGGTGPRRSADDPRHCIRAVGQHGSNLQLRSETFSFRRLTGKVTPDQISDRAHCSLVYSARASLSIGSPGSASFHSAKRSS